MDREAERRRQALLRFMKAHRLKRGTLARQTGISPNIVYNFLAGKSSYLSQPTLERIAQTFKVPTASLTGEDQAKRLSPAAFQEQPSDLKGNQGSAPLSSELTRLKLAGSILEGRLWSETIFVEPDEDEFASFSLPSLYAAKAFALKLDSAAMAAILPKGAMLGCVPIADYLQRLQPGDIVIVVRRNETGLFQASARQYLVESGRHYVSSRPSGRGRPDRLELLSPLDDPAALGHQDFFIHAIVLGYIADLPALRR